MLGKVLGEGGFGITYLAWDLNLEIQIAIKEYFPLGLASRNTIATGRDVVSILSEDSRERYEIGLKNFVSEARNLAHFQKLKGVVAIKEFFYENATAYMVMDYIKGVTLKRMLEKNPGCLTESFLLSKLKPVIESLGKMHQGGIIHRDISPDNLIYGEDEMVTLIDFGAAREMTGKKDGFTIVLKQGYAPEEQYRTKGHQGPWTDVYALCATIYHLLSGKRPPNSMDRMENDELKPLEEMGIQVSPSVSRAIQRGLAVSAKDRIQDMFELENLLYTNHSYSDFHSTSANMHRDMPKDAAATGGLEGTESISGRGMWERESIRSGWREEMTGSSENRSQRMLQDMQREKNPPDGTNRKKIMIFAGVAVAFMAVAGIGIMSLFGGGSSATSADFSTSAELAQSKAVGVPATEQEGQTQEEQEEQAEGYEGCLSPDKYVEKVSQDGGFSFSYPPALYTNIEEIDGGYYLSGDDGVSSMTIWEVPVAAGTDLDAYIQSRYAGEMNRLYESEKIIYKDSGDYSGDSVRRFIINGYLESEKITSVYLLVNLTSAKESIMEIHYPQPNSKKEKNQEDYVVDCLYRMCSFSGTTYLPRTYKQFKNEDMGTKK